jgi:hypothetical protein
MDRQVAFTKAQRERLQPLAERLIAKPEELFPEPNQQYVNYSTAVFLKAGSAAKTAELKPVLDASQLRHWQEACSKENVRRTNAGDDDEEPAGSRRPNQKKAASPTDAEPEGIERHISDFCFEKADAKRRAWLTEMQVRAEDLARVTRLSPDKLARLRTAANGAAEASLVNWRRQIDQIVRSSIRGTNPEAVPQRLASMESYMFYQNVVPAPESEEVWAKTSAAVITPAQKEAWQSELKEREAFRSHAISDFILAEFDRQQSLTTAQFTELQSKIAKALEEYGSAIGNMFSGSGSTSWFLQPYCRMLPIFAIPEAELKKILTPAQWERWTSSYEYGNAANYWSNIQQVQAQKREIETKLKGK